MVSLRRLSVVMVSVRVRLVWLYLVPLISAAAASQVERATETRLVRQISEEDRKVENAHNANTFSQLVKIGLLESDKLKTSFNELMGRTNRSLKVAFSEKVMSNTALQEFIERYKMKISREDTVAREPHLKINIMANASTVYVVKSVNQYYYWKYVQNVSTVLIFSLIVVGNISILHRLKSCRRRRSNVNYFIVQLAIADLFVGIFSVTLDSVFRLTMTFPFGLTTCRIYKYMSNSFTYSATYLLVALSFDRWEAVVKPLAFTQNHRRGQHLVLGAWILSFICASPVFIDLRIKEVQGHPQCYIDHSPLAWRYYVVYLSISLFVVPALLIAICYVHIVYTIWGKGQLVKNQRRALRQRQLSGLQLARLKSLGSSSGSISETNLAAVAALERAADAPGAEPRSSIGDKLARLREVDEPSDQSDVESSSSLEFDEEEEEEVDAGRARTSLAGELKVNGAVQQTGLTYAPTVRSLGAQVEGIMRAPEGSEHEQVRVSRSEQFETQPIGQKRRGSSRHRKRTGQVLEKKDYVAQQHGSGVIPRARVKTIKMTLVIVAAFVLCWLPFCVINLCSAYGILDKSSVPKTALLTLSQSLAHLNSAANPIIFWIFSSKRTGARPAPSGGSQYSRRRLRRHKSIWISIKRILCCRCECLPCGGSRGGITTDSRMFECTGSTNKGHAITLTQFDNPALEYRVG